MEKLSTSYSALTTHRACPQKWVYASVRRLGEIESLEARVELDFGTWWHALRAAESIERGRRLGTIASVPKHLRPSDGWRVDTDVDDLQGAVLEEAGRWWAAQPSLHQGVWKEKLGGDLIERLAYVDARWVARWAAQREFEEPLAVEFWWSRMLPAVSRMHTPDGRVVEMDPNVSIGGFIDEIYYDRKRAMVVVRDHKSHKALSTMSVQDMMMDSQLHLYGWGGAPAVREFGRGPVKAIAHDRVRMVASKVPKLNLSGTLSKSITDFDLHTYRTWAAGPDGFGPAYPGLKKDGSGAGRYTADSRVMDNLSTESSLSIWQQRTLLPLNPNIVKVHLRAAVDSACDARTTTFRYAEEGMVQHNFTTGCKWCPFSGLCRAEIVGGPRDDVDLEAFGLRKRP